VRCAEFRGAASRTVPEPTHRVFSGWAKPSDDPLRWRAATTTRVCGRRWTRQGRLLLACPPRLDGWRSAILSQDNPGRRAELAGGGPSLPRGLPAGALSQGKKTRGPQAYPSSGCSDPAKSLVTGEKRRCSPTRPLEARSLSQTFEGAWRGKALLHRGVGKRVPVSANRQCGQGPLGMFISIWALAARLFRQKRGRTAALGQGV